MADKRKRAAAPKDEAKPPKAPAKKPAAKGKEGQPKAPRAPRKRAARPAAGTGEEAAAAPAAETEPGTLAVVNAQNEKVGEVALHPDIFLVKVNEHLLYEAVKQYRAGARAGTHMTKNRALVSGSGRKPWRQKGTGRARVGSIRTPLWRHGGTVFGPTPRDYSYNMPKKARTAALRSALSQRVREGALKVVERFGVEEPRTKLLKAILDQLGVSGKAVLVEHRPGKPFLLSGRNIPGISIVDPSELNAYHVLDCRTLVVSQDALGKLEERLAP